jgi:hypothetical protein
MIKRTTLAILLVAVVGAGLFWLTSPNIAALRDANPETTALIDARAEEAAAEGRGPRGAPTWVPHDKI